MFNVLRRVFTGGELSNDMIKFRGHLYRAAYTPAPLSLKISKRKSDLARKSLIGFLAQLDGEAAGKLAECCLWKLPTLRNLLSFLVRDWNRTLDDDIMSSTSLSQIINQFDLYGQYSEYEQRILQQFQDLVEDANDNYYEVDLLDHRWDDIEEAYDYDNGEGSFAAEAAPVLRNLTKLPSWLKAYRQFIDDLRATLEWQQHKSRSYLQQGAEDPHPPGVEDLELVWHATTAYKPILEQGFKTRSELGGQGGLGGSMSTTGIQQEGISFTGNEEVARSILESFWDMAELLQGPRDKTTLMAFARRLEIPEDTIQKYIPQLYRMDEDEQLSPRDTFDIVRNIIGQASVLGTYYDPVYLLEEGTVDTFMRLKPNDTGVIEAIIDTTKPDARYFRSMDEWRVPLDAIVSYGPVGSQQLPRSASAIQRQAANPAQDEAFRRQAVQAYEELIRRANQKQAKPVKATGEDIGPDGRIVAWSIDNLEAGLNVQLRPRPAGSQTNGQYIHSKFGPSTIILYNGDPQGDFWRSDVDHQLMLLPYALSRRTFVHEYIHALDWKRAPHIGYGGHKTIGEMDDQEYAAYLSEPAEFNAWFQSFANEIEREINVFVDKVPSNMWPDHMKVTNAFVTWFMRSFKHNGWRIDILPAKIQRKIQKRLAQMFQHVWRDPEPDQFDIQKYLASMNEQLWAIMEMRVERLDYMDDPDGVETRFDQFIGSSFEEFLSIHGSYLDKLQGSQLLAAKTGLRELYRQLQQERDGVVQAGRRKKTTAAYYRQYEPGALTHRRHSPRLSDYVVLFTDDEERNQHYGDHVWTLNTDLPEVPDYIIEFAADYYDVDLKEAEELVDPPNIVDSAGAWDDPEFVYAVWEQFEEPGYRTYDGAVVLDKEAVQLEYRYDED